MSASAQNSTLQLEHPRNDEVLSSWSFKSGATSIISDLRDYYFHILKKDNSDTNTAFDALATSLNDAIDYLDAMPLPDDPYKKERCKKLLRATAENLRSTAVQLVDQRIKEGEITSHVRSIWQQIGRFDAEWHLIDRPEIAVLVPHNAPRALELRPLPPDAIPEQQTLIVEVMRAVAVIKIVFDRRRQRTSLVRRWWQSLRPSSSTTNMHKLKFKELDELESSYLRELKDIADTAISRSALLYAQQRLNAFKDAFVSREADAVKNHYIGRLGLWAAAYILVFVVLFITPIILEWFGVSPNMQDTSRSFLLLLAGSSAGTWISFSLRKVTLSFNDLAVLEEDHLNPAGRLAFVALLTLLLGIMIYKDLLSVSIGDKGIEITESWLTSFLVGALCGIAERSLSGMISRRANDVVNPTARPEGRTNGGQK